MKKPISRREFVTVSSRIAVGAAVAGCACGFLQSKDECCAQETAKVARPDPSAVLNYNPNVEYRRLGKTGLWISAMSLGGHWKNREGGRYWDIFDKDKVPADARANREAAVAQAVESGLNYLDLTTPAEACVYGEAFKSLGVKMHVGYSDHILCMRNPNNRTHEKLMLEIDEGLRRLQMDTMTIWRPQAVMDNAMRKDGGHTDDEMKVVVETFHKAREQGKVQHLGISSHDRQFLMHLMRSFPEFEMMIFPVTLGTEAAPTGSIFDLAGESNVGTVTIKPYAGGSLFRRPNRQANQLGADLSDHEIARLVIRKITENRNITATIPGMTLPEEIRNNAAAVADRKKLTHAERATVARYAKVTMANLPHDYAWLRNWQCA